MELARSTENFRWLDTSTHESYRLHSVLKIRRNENFAEHYLRKRIYFIGP